MLMSINAYTVTSLTVAVSVDFSYRLFHLGLGGILADLAHDGGEVGGRDAALAVLVKQHERLLELCDDTHAPQHAVTSNSMNASLNSVTTHTHTHAL